MVFPSLKANLRRLSNTPQWKLTPLMTTHRQLHCLKTLQQGQPCHIGNRTAHLSGGNDTVLCFDGFDVLYFFLFFYFFFYSFFYFLLFYYYFYYLYSCMWLAVGWDSKVSNSQFSFQTGFRIGYLLVEIYRLRKRRLPTYSKQKVTNVLSKCFARSSFTGHIILLCDSLRESFYARIKYI